MKKIAIIPARSGSKGLPNKNVLLLDGKPLIAYSIEAALKSKVFEKIIITTDSLEYKDAIAHYPVDVIIRSPELSSDTASSYVVIKDTLERNLGIEYDYFMLLQPTSPLRTEHHILESIEKFEKNSDRFDFLVSMVEGGKPSTLFRPLDENESLKAYNIDYSNYSRQQYREYHPNGAIYIAKTNKYLEQKHFYGENSIAYLMNKKESIDIDDELDFDYLYFILQQKNKNQNHLNKIINRIKEKSDNFNNVKDITLLGDSIFGLWDIKEINGLSFNNISIEGISTKEYLDHIFNKNMIKKLGSYVFINLGSNDIIKPDYLESESISALKEITSSIKEINKKSEIFLLEIIYSAFRKDRSNISISKLNQEINSTLFGDNIKIIEINHYLQDQYGKLNLKNTIDGLNLNKNGYSIVEKVMSREIHI
ncbi:cytidylyltransferase domain-containing protein [Testudinibacter sp. P27/CKL/0425]